MTISKLLDHRTMMILDDDPSWFAKLENNINCVGFSNRPSETYPTREEIVLISSPLMKPRLVWETIALSHLMRMIYCADNPFLKIHTWVDKVRWVYHNPEPVDRMISLLDRLVKERYDYFTIWLDITSFTEVDVINAAFQFALEMRPTQSIRVKVVARPSVINMRGFGCYTDASKVFASRLEL